jgi:cation transport protein ChaC
MVELHTLPSTNSTATTITTSAGKPIQCLVYIGLPENPQFMGPQSTVELARHIARSHGPSGANSEYVYMLEEALKGVARDVGLDVEGGKGGDGEEEIDGHVVDLARRVRLEEKKMREEGKGSV